MVDDADADALLVRYEERDGIAVVLLDRPRQRNALCYESWTELSIALGGIVAYGARGVVLAGAGGFNPRYFITICKSFHASFFCRGSRSRYAGWYVTSSFESLKSYQRPRRLAMESFTASRFLAATAPSATITLGLMISIWRIRNGEQRPGCRATMANS